MPKGLLGASPRGGSASPLDRELADATRAAKAVGVIRQLAPAPTADPALTAVLTPILTEWGTQMVEQMRRTGQPPSQDDVSAAIKRAVDLKTLKSLDEAPSAPQPTTATEMMALAQGAASIHQGAAETAMAQAEQERQRRAEAEENAAGQASYARQDEAGKWSTMLKITQDNNALMLALYKDLALQQQQALIDKHAQQLAAINEKLDVYSTAHKRELDTTERLHAADLEAKEKEAAWALDKLRLEHQLAAAPRSETVQDMLNKTWAEQQGRLMKLEADDKEEEARQKRERSDEFTSLLSDFREHVLPNVGQFLGGPAPVVRHGIPPVPPPPDVAPEAN